jgi:hypothetical protein
MLHELQLPTNRNKTLALLAIAAVLTAAALVVGISDNIPGIVLMYLAALALVLAFVHPWRSPKQFLWLCAAAIVTFLVTAVLENAFEVGATLVSGQVLQGLLGAIGATFFIIATVICPAALLVGLGGAIGAAIQPAH